MHADNLIEGFFMNFETFEAFTRDVDPIYIHINLIIDGSLGGH